MKKHPLKTIVSNSAQTTFSLGKTIGSLIHRQIAIALKGDLGTGKTTFTQGVARGLGVPESYYITSPTFNIINQYPVGDFTFCHMDLYRLGSSEELEYTGFEDMVKENHILVVEWPELLEEIDFQTDMEIHFQFDEDYNRIISFSAFGQDAENLIDNLGL